MFLGSRIALLVACLWLLLARAAVAAPTVQISSRHYLPGLDSVSPGLGLEPAAAASDTGYLVVYLAPGGPYPSAVVGRLVDAEGVPIGPQFDIRVTPNDVANTWTLSVVFDGATFVITWLERELESPHDPLDRVFFARVSASGELLTPPTLLDARTDHSQPAVSAGETGTLIVDCFPLTCKAWLIDHEGVVLAGGSFPARRPIQLVYSDGAWLAWTSGGHLEQYSGDATLVDGTSADLSVPIPYFTSGAPSPDGFVLTSEDDGAVHFTHVGFDGSVEALGKTPPIPGYASKLHATSSGYLLSYYRYDDPPCPTPSCDASPRLQLLNRALELQGEATRAGTAPSLPTISPDGTRGLLVFPRISPNASYAPFVRALTFTGASIQIGDEHGVPTRTGSMWTPFAAPGPNGWLLVWQETAPTNPDRSRVRGALVDENGAEAGEPFVITDNNSFALVGVARGPDGWLVALSGSTDLFLVSDTGESKKIGSQFLNSSALAGSMNGWLLVRNWGTFVDAVWYDTNGPIGAVALANAASQEYVDVTYGAGNYFATWRNANGAFVAKSLPTDSATDASPEVLLASGTAALPRRAIRTHDGWFAIAAVDGVGYQAWWQGSAGKQALGDSHPALPVVGVGRLVLTGLRAQAGGPIQVELAEPGGELVSMAEVDLNEANLSEAHGTSVLLTGTVSDRSQGSQRDRAAWHVVQVTDDWIAAGGSGGDAAGGSAGGVGGAAGGTSFGESGAAANEAGASATAGSTNEPGGGVGGETPSAGGAASGVAIGGVIGDGGGDENSHSLESSSTRQSRACGCRVPGRQDDGDRHALWLTLPMLIWGRRRRSARYAAAPRLRNSPGDMAHSRVKAA